MPVKFTEILCCHYFTYKLSKCNRFFFSVHVVISWITLSPKHVLASYSIKCNHSHTNKIVQINGLEKKSQV